SKNIEILCNFIRDEECPKVAVILLNLLAEGWIEEIFHSLQQKGIAPRVFEEILRDEHRHVCEADLYRDIGLPDKDVMRRKVAFLEEHLLVNVLMQFKYVFSVQALLGMDGTQGFIEALHRKHQQQLEKLD